MQNNLNKPPYLCHSDLIAIDILPDLSLRLCISKKLVIT